MKKTSWPDSRLLRLLGIELPIIQAPMAGPNDSKLAIAVSSAGGLGSLPCALLSADQVKSEWALIRAATQRPVNLNFFCHEAPVPDPEAEQRWRDRLAVYAREFGLDPAAPYPPSNRNPFDETACDLVERVRPEVVSFHFGLPREDWLARVQATGAKVLSSATTVAEARWLAERGCDAIIAQGWEAGGHRGMFLSQDLATQVGTLALVPQVVDAVTVPVIAAGGIADARGIAAAFALGAAGVQLGTAYLFCPEARVSAVHAKALRGGDDDGEQPTALTNLFTGRPARGIQNRLMREVGPMSNLSPAFPLAGGAVGPLRARAEQQGSGDFSPLWAGQAVRLVQRDMSAGELTRRLADQALQALSRRD